MSKEAQAREYLVAQKAHPPELGAPVFLVASGWFNAWSRFVGIQAAQGAPSPGPITNGPLVSPLGIRRGIRAPNDFVFLTKPVWDLLLGWYGGGPAVERNTAVNPETGEIEPVIRSRNVKVRFGGDVWTTKVHEFTRVGDLRKAACRHFKVEPKGLSLVDVMDGKMLNALNDLELVEKYSVVECWPLVLTDSEPDEPRLEPSVEWIRESNGVVGSSVKGIDAGVNGGYACAVMQCLMRAQGFVDGSGPVGSAVEEFKKMYKGDDKVADLTALKKEVEGEESDAQGDAHEFFTKLLEKGGYEKQFDVMTETMFECMQCHEEWDYQEPMTSLSVDAPVPEKMSREIKFVSYDVDEPMIVYRMALPLNYTKETVEQIISLDLHRRVEIAFAERVEQGLEWVALPSLLEDRGPVYAFEVPEFTACYVLVDVMSCFLDVWSGESLKRIAHPHIVEVNRQEGLLRACEEKFGALFRKPMHVDDTVDVRKLHDHSHMFEGKAKMLVRGNPNIGGHLASPAVELVLNPMLIKDRNNFDWRALKDKHSRVAKERKDAQALHSCLEHFLRPQVVEGMCHRCGEAPVLMSSKLCELPKSLVIHVKRYKKDLTKIRSEVDFPDELVLDNSLLKEEVTPGKYKLIGVVEHVGGLAGGHYTAHVLSAEGGWIMCDQQEVRASMRRKAHSESAYMLFYDLIE